MILSDDYREAVEYWNGVFAMTDADKSQGADDPESWKEMVPSMKLVEKIGELDSSGRFLDYGCGSGWACIAAAKAGFTDILGVDVTENGITAAEYYGDMYGISRNTEYKCIPLDWLEHQREEQFDSVFCSNVLDVVPEDVSEYILKGIASVLRNGGRAVIGLNYYKEPIADETKGINVKNGNCIFINGILRLVSLTDEQWTEKLSRYFQVEELDHFRWPGETSDRRRVFVLRK